MELRLNGTWPAQLVLLTLVGVLAAPADAAPVLIETASGTGRGIARMRGPECVVVAPRHLFPESAKRRVNATAIDVIGPGGSRGSAEYVGPVGLEADDSALIRLISAAESICDESEAAQIKAKQAAVIALREERGDLAFVPVDVLSKTDQFIAVGGRSSLTRLEQMMSGGTLIESGRSRGMLLSAATTEDVGKVIDLDYLAGLLGTWVKDPSSNVSAVQEGLDILRTAIEMKPTGDIGQIAAAEALVADGSGLAGMDLRGLSFAGANLRDGDFTEAQLIAARLSRATFKRANLEGALLEFADVAGADFGDANLKRARLYFAEAANGQYQNARLQRSNWLGADASGSDFSDADLSGASFAFADLSNAIFDRAKLENTVFLGAIVAGASFKDAVLHNTDATGAVGNISQFAPVQRPMLCARETRQPVLSVELIRVIPSTRFSSGKDFDEFGGRDEFLVGGGLMRLRRCDVITEQAEGKELFYYHGTEQMTQGFRFHYNSDLLDKGGRRRQFEERVNRAVKNHADKRTLDEGIVFESETHRALTAQLERVRPSAPSNTPIYLDSTAALAYRARQAPDSITDLQWALHARQWQQRDQSSSQNAQTTLRMGDNAWPQFFPPGISFEQLRPVDVRLYGKWIRGLADTLPKRLWLVGDGGVISLSYLVQGGPDGDIRFNPFRASAELATDGSAARASSRRRGQDTDTNELARNPIHHILATSTVVLERPISAFDFHIPKGVVRDWGVTRVYPQAEVEITDIKFEVVDRSAQGSSNETAVRYFVRVVGYQLVDDDGRAVYKGRL